MSRWDTFLNTATSAVGTTAAVGSQVFDLINSGKETGVSSVGLVRDINTNGFLATDSVYVPNYFVRAFDEPTYLTFKLEFLFHNPRNVLYSNRVDQAWRNYNPNGAGTSENDKDVPPYVYSLDGDTEHAYDYLPEAFLQDSMLAQNDGFYTVKDKSGYWPQSGRRDKEGRNLAADEAVGYYYSAEDYLGLNRGEFGRAKLMRKIKMMLADLQDNFPYYFRSIDGLSDLNKIAPGSGRRLGEEVTLTIKCYEGIDLKITQLLQLIRKVTWDDSYQRWILPDIMRYFGMRIYVSEIRTFHEAHTRLNNPFSNIPKLHLYDFKNEDQNGKMRNATEMPLTRNLYRDIMNATGQILTATQALGDQFFDGTGFDNVVTQVNNTFGAFSEMSTSLANMYQMMCVSAVNEVMPTICYECHMCEFDISDTAMELNTLHSTSGDPQEQTIRIKVKQVEDFQMYPLDKNLTLNKDKTAYALDNKMYGYSVDEDLSMADEDIMFSEEDNTVYANKRKEGYTGSTVFADRLFNETFNGQMRSMYNKAKGRGNAINDVKLYRNLASVYDDAVRNYFVNLGFNIINSDFNTSDSVPISPRMKMYPGEKAQQLMHSEKGPLRYKRNSLDVMTNIMTLLVSGLNATSDAMQHFGAQNSMTTFSKATSITREELMSTLPDIHAAALALRETVQQFQETDFGDTEMGEYELLHNLAFSKATRYTPMGPVAQTVLNAVTPWSSINGYSASPNRVYKSTIAQNNQAMNNQYRNIYVNNPKGERPKYWTTVGQDPDHKRDVDLENPMQH